MTNAEVTKALIVIFYVMIITLSAQMNSKITGRVTDYQTGDPLIGCNVILEGTGIGAATDMDGYFNINNIPLGSYNIIASYIGYKTNRIYGFKVDPGRAYRLDIRLYKSDLRLENVVVKARVLRKSTSFLIMEKKKSSSIVDGVSSNIISLFGDANAADAAKRIVGVSVTDDNYANIRGMGERYITTSVNNISVPSPEPEKKVIPLNMFPSQIVESIIAIKTYTPDLPATFGGGSINIKTKAYPDNRVMSLSLSSQLSENVMGLDKFYLDNYSISDLFGFDNARSLPSIVPKNLLLTQWNSKISDDFIERLNILGNIGRSFSTKYNIEESNNYVPLSFGVSFGNRYGQVDKIEYGFFTNTIYSGKSYYNSKDQFEYSLQNNILRPRLGINVDEYGFKTNLSSSFSAGVKLFKRHKIGFFSLYAHQSNNSTEIGKGFADNFDYGVFLKKYYSEKSIFNTNVTGEHNFNFVTKNVLNWRVVYGESRFYEPDLRRVNYRQKTNSNGESYYQMDLYSWSAGPREFSNGIDNQFELSIDNLTTFTVKGNEFKFKVGINVLSNSRNFGRRSFYHIYAGKYSTGVIPSELTIASSIEEMGSLFNDSNYFHINGNGEIVPGLIIVENTNNHDAYRSNERLLATYFMADFSPFKVLRVTGGLRFERYNLNLVPYNPVTLEKFYSNILGDTIIVDRFEFDYLPSINFVLSLINNLRISFAFSKTLGRPQFREIAPFEFQALYGDEIIVGYPFLKTTSIRNFDIRLDWFKSAGEVISIGLFHKYLDNPIEVALLEASGKYYKTFQNARYAKNTGLEFDSRIRLSILPINFGVLFFNTNLTYILSKVTAYPEVAIFTGYKVKNQVTSTVRPLLDNSKITFNMSVEYKNSKGYMLGLTYNTFSKKFYSLGVGGIPDKNQLPFNSLNVNLGKTIGRFKMSIKVKNLLDDYVKYGHVDNNGKFINTMSYKPGHVYSFSIGYQL